MDYRVSAVIPVRNRPELVRKAVMSCLAQTYALQEIVVVDDASTDETVSVLQDLAATDGRIRLIVLDSALGAAGARNAGVRSATGDLIAFLDSDDTWYPEKTALQVEVLKQASATVAVFCGVRYAYVTRPAVVRTPAPVITARDLWVSNAIGSTSTGMVRRDSFLAVGGFDGTLQNSEDWDLWLKLSVLGDLRVVQAPLVTYTYVANNKFSRDVVKLFKGHEQLYERILSQVPVEDRLYVAAMHQLKLAELNVRVIGDRRAAAMHAAKALKLKFNWKIATLAARLALISLIYGARN